MASTLLTKSAATPTNRKKYTVSFWCKKALFGINQYVLNTASDGSNRLGILFNTSEQLEIYGQTSGSENAYVRPTRLFRDPSAFYHIVVAVDTTQSTAADRMKIYVNGTLETVMTSTNYPSQNADLESHRNHYIGGYGVSSNYYFGGCLAHFHFVDGTAYPASTFGETDSTSGIWKPKTAPSVTYGDIGYFLKFENSGNLDLDSSGNNLSFTTSGTLTQNTDTPSNNFATLNAVARDHTDTSSLSNGNLTYALSNYSLNARSSLAMTAGKWYWEYKQSGKNLRPGVCTSGFNPNLDTDSNDAYYGNATGRGGIYIMHTNDTTTWQRTNNNTSANRDSYTTALATGANDIIGCALDVGTGKLHFSVNGTWLNSGNPATGANPQITLTNSSGDPLHAFVGFNSSSSMTAHLNFGSGYFGTTAVASANADANGHGAMEYAVPSGFYTLNTKNIKEFG